MTSAAGETTQGPPDGVRWLKIIGYGNLIGRQVTLADGRVFSAEQFPDISERCRIMAGDLFRGIEARREDDPEREEDVQLGKDIFENHFLEGSIIAEVIPLAE